VKAVAQRREGATTDLLAGRVLCHDVRDAAGKVALGKGARLPWDELHLLALEAGDLHEEDAGRRLAASVTGDGVEVKGYSGGQWTLTATRRGLLRVDVARLAAVNVHEGVAVFTLLDRQPVDRGETVAKAKVTPLAIGADTVLAVEQAARGGAVTVAAFRPVALGTVARESLEPKQRARFESALRTKIDWFGGRLLPVRFAGASPRAVADEMSALRAEGADPVFGGLTLLGARMERHGAPAHPGSLLFLARWQDLPVLGMPTCGMFSQATTFDLVLPRLLAGEAIANAEIAALGHGGLLSREMAYRFPPYRAGAARGELE